MYNGVAVANSTPDYTMGYSEELMWFLSRFVNNYSVSGFLSPYFKPGLQALDVGCGPGFLALKLADSVAPGKLYGIDVEPSQIDMAQALAADRGCDNAVFQVADALSLPFPDESFDIAHLGGVLLHVPDTDAAITEVKRVLKPGGVLVCRDIMVDSCFAHPELGTMQRGWEVFADLLAADDGHPQIGRDVKLHLVQAGFEDVDISASFEIYSTRDELEFFYLLIKQYFFKDLAEAANKYGAATDSLLFKLSGDLEEWRLHPGALAGVAFSHAVGYRP